MQAARFKNRGFSLMELMIAVAIVGILAGVAYPAFTSQIVKGRLTECRSAILQSMQQQERYYSQYNAYAGFADGATTAKSKYFSGDTLATSSCTLQGEASAVGGVPNQAIEIRANAIKPNALSNDSSISYLYLTSDGVKGCAVSSTRTTSNKTCWP